MQRSATIASILEKRRPLAKKIEDVETNLRELSSVLHELEDHRRQLTARLSESDVLGQLTEVSLTQSLLSINLELQSLAKLKARFSRETLNIGVVGRARQGKSRFLQSLTSLTAAEIPDGNRLHCTGVRSTIRHNSSVESYGEVWFHSERSFLDEVIAPYYKKLNLGSKPTSLETFARNPLPSLPQDTRGYAEPGAMYEHLERYHKNVGKYKDLLTSPSPRRIRREEIREYVAQDTPDGERIFFNYLAVREVKITCRFPNEDIGQIALVDMPGLGDTGVGDEERLVQTLGEEVDAVLFIRMPKSSGDYWADVDVRLYDTTHDALVDLPVNLWSFLILNRTDSNSSNQDNYKNCKDLEESLAQKHIAVVQHMIANCADPTESGAVLDVVLNYMIDKITWLDRRYAAARQEKLNQLRDSIEIEIEKAKHALGSTIQGGMEFRLFEQLFEQLWDNLTNGLENLLGELREHRDYPDIDFKQQVDAALSACQNDTGIPSIEQIEVRRNRVGGYPNAYYEYLNEIRAHLSQHFLLIDQGLKQGLERVKSRVAEVLISKGHLGNLTEAHGTEFLHVIAGQFPEELTPNQPCKVKLGFQILATFELAYRGLIQHRIRQHLDDLTPDTTELQLSSSPSAQEVLDCLNSLHAEAVYQCGTALDDLLSEPSQAAFAIVEEFLDRILRAEGVKTEWRIFLQEVRSDLWIDQFNQLGERTKIRREWQELITRATTANHSDKLSFLNH